MISVLKDDKTFVGALSEFGFSNFELYYHFTNNDGFSVCYNFINMNREFRISLEKITQSGENKYFSNYEVHSPFLPRYVYRYMSTVSEYDAVIKAFEMASGKYDYKTKGT